ncbi:hypothetical protein D3C75_1004900 [compost metagenome]
MTEAVHYHAGHRFHVRWLATFRFPVDAARHAGDGVVQGCCASRVDRLDFALGNGFAPGRWRRIGLHYRLVFQYLSLFFGHLGFGFCGQGQRG